MPKIITQNIDKINNKDSGIIEKKKSLKRTRTRRRRTSEIEQRKEKRETRKKQKIIWTIKDIEYNKNVFQISQQDIVIESIIIERQFLPHRQFYSLFLSNLNFLDFDLIWNEYYKEHR